MSKKFTKLSLHDFHAKHGKPVDILPSKSGSSNRECGDQGHSRLAGTDCHQDGRHSGLGSFAYGRSSGIGSSGQCYSTYPSTFQSRDFGEPALGPATDCPSSKGNTSTTCSHGQAAGDFSQSHHAMSHASGKPGRDGQMLTTGGYGASAPAQAMATSAGAQGFGRATHAAYSGRPVYAGSATATAVPRDGWVPPPPPPRRMAACDQREPAEPRISITMFSNTDSKGMVRQPAAGSRGDVGPDATVRAALQVTTQQESGRGTSSKAHAVGSNSGFGGQHEIGSVAGQVNARCSIQKAGPQVESLEAKWKGEPQGRDLGGSTTPFASVPSSARASPAVVKNEFAEKLAQKAMANAALAKSSLLSVSSLGSAHSGSGSFEVAVASVAADAGAADPAASGVFVKPTHPYDRPRLATVFGAAKPREEVLKERGIDPAQADQLTDSVRLSDTGGTKLSSVGQVASDSYGSYGGLHNGEDHDWHTVTAGRKGKAGDGHRLLAEADVVDPFFGPSAGSFGPAADAGGRASGNNIMRLGKPYYDNFGEAGNAGSYGRMGSGQIAEAGGSWAERRACYEEADDNGFGRRGLPTRHAFVGL
eukprot:gene11822-11966_t